MKFIKLTDVNGTKYIINTAHINFAGTSNQDTAGNILIQITGHVIKSDLTLEELFDLIN